MVFVTTFPPSLNRDCSVVAYSAADGAVLWQKGATLRHACTAGSRSAATVDSLFVAGSASNAYAVQQWGAADGAQEGFFTFLRGNGCSSYAVAVSEDDADLYLTGECLNSRGDTDMATLATPLPLAIPGPSGSFCGRADHARQAFASGPHDPEFDRLCCGVAAGVGRDDGEPVAAAGEASPLRQPALEADLVEPAVTVRQREGAGSDCARARMVVPVATRWRDALVRRPTARTQAREAEREPCGYVERDAERRAHGRALAAERGEPGALPPAPVGLFQTADRRCRIADADSRAGGETAPYGLVAVTLQLSSWPASASTTR